MKKLIALTLCLLFLSACSGPDNDARRIDALEAEVKAMKGEAARRDKALKEELAMVRKNLESIREVLELDRARLPEGAESSDPELDAKAKSFVNENLDRLLELTRKMLDKMEKEFDEHLKGTKETSPQGDEI